MSLRRLVVFVAFALAFALALDFTRKAFGIASPWFGVLAMFCVLGMSSLAPASIAPTLPRWFADVGEHGSTSRRYAALHVRQFGWLLTHTPLRFLNASVYLNAQRGDVAHVRARVEAAEAAHFWAALVLLPYIAIALSRRWWSAAIALTLVELVWNVYPLLHLRLTRARLDAVEKRMSMRRARDGA